MDKNAETDDRDLTLILEELKAEMTQIQADRAELAQLRSRLAEIEGRPASPNLPRSDLSSLVPSAKATSRRKALGRIGGGLMAAGLGASLPLFSTSAAPEQQITPGSDGTYGGTAGPGKMATNPNAQPTLAPDGSLTQTFSGYDFHPVISGTIYSFANFGGIYWTGTGDNNFWLRLDLPQDAKVTNVTFYYTDNDIASNIIFYFCTLNPTNHLLNNIKSMSTTGASNSTRTVTFTGTAASPIATVDNSIYSYYLLATFYSSDDSVVLWGAKVSYVNIVGRFRAQ